MLQRRKIFFTHFGFLKKLQIFLMPLGIMHAVHTGKKLSLQESNQLIGIKMPTSVFSRNIWFLNPISRRGKRVRPTRAPWQAKCKNWAPFS